MLTLQVINADPEGVIAKLAKKHFDAKAPVTRILELDVQRHQHRGSERHEEELHADKGFLC